MIFFLHGSDTFRSRRKLKEIKSKFIDQVDKSNLNTEILQGDKLEIADFEKAISTPAFLAKKRLIIVENFFASQKNTKLSKDILEIINKNPLEDTILVFFENTPQTSKYKKNNKTNNPLFTSLKKEKLSQNFDQLNQNDVYNFINFEITIKKGKINPQATRLLGDIVGNDLWRLNTEIDKLIAYTNKQEITVETINELIKDKLNEDIFKLTEALGQKNKKIALKLISDQLKLGTSPLELLTKIIWQFKNLIIIKNFTENNGPGYNDQHLSYQFGLHPFVVKKTMAQVNHHEMVNLKKIYKHLLNIDYKIKTSQTNPEVLFDLLVIKS